MKRIDSDRHVSLTIDGRAVQAPLGATILDAARAVGIDVPTLCQHEWVSPIGSCRLCIVKVQGLDGVVASCTTPASEGMVVTTHDEELTRLRCEQMQYILLNHPLDCPVCDKAGECRLQDLTYALGVSRQDLRGALPEEQRIDTQSALIERNDARCVRCGRCVAVCYEVMAVGAYRFAGRGYASRIDTQDGGPLCCEFCGQCVAICPVGALLSKPFKHRARVWDLAPVETVCGYCGAGCQLELNVRRNHVYRVTSNPRETSNRGLLCVRGSFGFEYVHNTDRGKSPAIRREGTLTPVDWREAFEAVAEGVRRASEAGGADALGVLISPRLPLEDVYSLASLFGGLGARRIALTGHDGYVRAWRTVAARWKHAGSTATFDDLGRADALLLVGADLAAEMPAPHLQVLSAVREHDASLVCAHSLPTKLEDFATSRLRYRPGEETATLLLLLRALADAKAQNLDFIIKHTTGFAAFKTALDRLDSAALAKRAGLEWDDVRRAAAQLAAAKRLVVVLGQQALAAAPEDNAGLALDLLTMLGGVEHGLLLTSDRNDAWGALLALQAAGVAPATFREVVEAGMNGRLNSLLVFGGDPLVSAPYAESLRKAMEVTGFVVAADAFLNRTAESANVFLPTQVFAERDGHVISAEGRLLRLRRAIEADENTLPESRIAAELARRLGRPLSENSPAAVWRELLTKNAALAATDAQAASRAGSLLPPFALRAESKIAFGAAPKPAEPVAGEMILVTGPVLFHNGALSTRAAGTREVCPGPWIALHPADAARLDVAAGEVVHVRRNGLSFAAPARLDARLTRGVAFAPHHFAEFPVGRLLGDSACVAVTITK